MNLQKKELRGLSCAICGCLHENKKEQQAYESKLWHDKGYPKIQLLTIEGLLNKTERVDASPQMNPFAKAQREAKPEKQTQLIYDCTSRFPFRWTRGTFLHALTGPVPNKRLRSRV
jgi:hypothetical protein